MKILNFIKEKPKLSFFLILAVAVLALYAQTLKYGFVYLDDDVLIIDLADILKDYKAVPSYFYKSVFDVKIDKYYRPFLTLSFSLDALIGGANPAFYHFTDLILHLFAVFLIFLLLIKLGFNEKTVFAFCLLFAVHPAFAQAVAWIPGRNDTLLAVFALLSLISVIKYLNTGRFYWLILHGFMLLSAIFTKETAVALLIIEPMMIFIFRKETLTSARWTRKGGGGKAAKEIGFIFLAAAAVYSVLRYEALKDTQLNISLPESLKYIYNAVPSVFQYCDFIINPSRLNVVPDSINIDAFSFTSFFIVMCIPLMAVFLLKSARKPAVFFGMCWFFIFLIPAFVLPQNIYFSHRLYVPAIGIIIMWAEVTGAVLELIRTKGISVLPAQTLIAVLFLLFFLASFLQIRKFQNREIFWQNALIDSPDSAFVNANAGMLYFDKGLYNESIESFLKAVKIKPGNSKDYNNIGRAYLKKRDYQAAFAFFEESLRLNLYNEEALYNLSRMYFASGNIGQAYNLAVKLIGLNSKDEVYAIYYRQVKDAVESGRQKN